MSPKLRACIGAAGCATEFQSFTGSFVFFAQTNTAQSIAMTVGTYSGLPSQPNQLRAFADPTVVIDPSFPSASAYSLEFSPGIGKTRPLEERAVQTSFVQDRRRRSFVSHLGQQSGKPHPQTRGSRDRVLGSSIASWAESDWSWRGHRRLPRAAVAFVPFLHPSPCSTGGLE